jgi:hypothetical protein
VGALKRRGKELAAAKLTAVYRERDALVAALSKLFEGHLATHEGQWEDDWRNIVCIHLPAGQATWHIHDSELPMFSHLPRSAGHWDGHSTAEKYQRLGMLAASEPVNPEADPITGCLPVTP